MSPKDLNTVRELLTVYERRSTCKRLQVAAVLTKDGRVIASGWNGVPHGLCHCEDHFAGVDEETMLREHGDFSTNNEIHAECNCLSFAARHGIATDGTDLACTYSPCLPCAKQIIASGVAHVYYKIEYDRDAGAGLQLLHKAGVSTTKLTRPSNNPYAMSPEDAHRVMLNAGIIDKAGNLTANFK